MKTATPTPAAPAAQSTDIDAALALISENMFEALLEFDWVKWRAELADDRAYLKELISLLARLSREVLAREKFREDLRAQQAQKEKRAPTLDEIEEVERRLKLL